MVESNLTEEQKLELEMQQMKAEASTGSAYGLTDTPTTSGPKRGRAPPSRKKASFVLDEVDVPEPGTN